MQAVMVERLAATLHARARPAQQRLHVSPSDLNDEDWALLGRLIPLSKPHERPRSSDGALPTASSLCCAAAAPGAICRATMDPAHDLPLFPRVAQRGSVGEDPRALAGSGSSACRTRGADERRHH